MQSWKRRTMKIIAEESANHFIKGFRQGGGQTDESKTGWERRQSREGAGRAILVKSGDLFQDIDVLEASETVIIIGTQRIVYAARHNEGLVGMPQREFIGPSKELEISNENELKEFMNLMTKGHK